MSGWFLIHTITIWAIRRKAPFMSYRGNTNVVKIVDHL